MSRLSFLADENVERSHIHFVHGFEVVAVVDEDNTGQRDDVHLAVSLNGNRAG